MLQSRILHNRSQPKLRLLSLDRPLPRLLKEDPATYSLFVEGVVLLAWDVAWLCRSQGLVTIGTWEAVCDIGRNLYRLFLANSAEEAGPSTKSPKYSPDSGPAIPKFGELSHSTSSRNLAGPSGMELVRAWPLPSLPHVIDKVKSHLLTEMSGAEWELLEEKEWNEDRVDEQAVLVGASTRRSLESRIGLSVMTATGGVEDDSGPRGRGASGWMKLKTRGDGI